MNKPSEYAKKLYLAIANRTSMRLDELAALPFGIEPDDLDFLFQFIGTAYMAELEMQKRKEFTIEGFLEFMDNGGRSKRDSDVTHLPKDEKAATALVISSARNWYQSWVDQEDLEEERKGCKCEVCKLIRAIRYLEIVVKG